MNFAPSFHFRVTLSHFLDVVMIMDALWTLLIYDWSVSPVSSAHLMSKGPEFQFLISQSFSA